MTPAQLGQWQLAHPGVDLFAPGAALVREEQAAVYSAAHRAFELLLEQRGVETPLAILAAMRRGLSFEAAFALVTQSTLPEFTARARAGVEQGAARGGRALALANSAPRGRGARPVDQRSGTSSCVNSTRSPVRALQISRSRRRSCGGSSSVLMRSSVSPSAPAKT